MPQPGCDASCLNCGRWTRKEDLVICKWCGGGARCIHCMRDHHFNCKERPLLKPDRRSTIKLCHAFNRGSCRFGAACRYVRVASETRVYDAQRLPRARKPPNQTPSCPPKLCHGFQRGFRRYGVTCRFAHAATEMQVDSSTSDAADSKGWSRIRIVEARISDSHDDGVESAQPGNSISLPWPSWDQMLRRMANDTHKRDKECLALSRKLPTPKTIGAAFWAADSHRSLRRCTYSKIADR